MSLSLATHGRLCSRVSGGVATHGRLCSAGVAPVAGVTGVFAGPYAEIADARPAAVIETAIVAFASIVRGMPGGSLEGDKPTATIDNANPHAEADPT